MEKKRGKGVLDGFGGVGCDVWGMKKDKREVRSVLNI